MIFPGQINTYISDEKLPWEYTWIEFDGLRAKETIELSGLSLDNPIYKATSKDLREIRTSLYCKPRRRNTFSPHRTSLSCN